MRRLLRFLAVVASTAILMTGTVVALTVIADNAFHQSASAQEIPLPPISDQLEEGSTVYASDGKTVLAVLKGPETRQPVPLSAVSKTMIHAVLDTEDHGFYQHGGFDVTSMLRALLNDAQGNSVQGGSTIPQQLVKQLYLTPVRSLNRKIREAVLADRLEQKYSRDAILDAYLNTIYLGNGTYGVQAAAEYYFNEPASELTLPQAALLAGMISDPSGYDPFGSTADTARRRRSEVLQRMVVYGDITPAQKAAAELVPLPTAPSAPQTPAPIDNYYALAVQNFLLYDTNALGNTYSERYQELFNGGLTIVTNMDPTMQADAERAVAADTPVNNGGFIEGLVSIDPATGAVRALVGGPSAAANQYDVMLGSAHGGRQPGSGFKLFTLLAALQQGYSVYDTIDAQGPCAIQFPGAAPPVGPNLIKNDNNSEGGTISLVSATAGSVNCAFIRLAHEVGLANVLAMAYQLGISPTEVPLKPWEYYPSVVLGAAAVAPIEMAGAYAAVADNGVFHKPSFVDYILDRTGTQIYSGLDPGTRVFSPQVAAEADIALRAVVTSGTGTGAALWNRPVAGKTGTTTHNVDAWFNGFTPQLETTVWMGNFNSDSVPIYICVPHSCPGLVYGANYPATTWRDYDAAVLAKDPVLQFPNPNWATLPPTRYITSPGLVKDDLSDHNGGGCYYYTYNGYYGSNYGGYAAAGGCGEYSSPASGYGGTGGGYGGTGGGYGGTGGGYGGTGGQAPPPTVPPTTQVVTPPTGPVTIPPTSTPPTTATTRPPGGGTGGGGGSG